MTITNALPQVINLSETNPLLAPLQGKQYDKAFKVVPNKVLPVELISQLQVCYSLLTGKELDPDGSTLAVKSVSGVFSRLYAPSAYKGTNPGELVIRWGDDIIEIAGKIDNAAKFLMPKSKVDSKAQLSIWHPGKTDPDNIEAQLLFGSFQGSRGNDTTLKLTCYHPDYPHGLDLHFSCWLADSEEFQNVNSDILNGLLRRGQFGPLSQFFKPVPSGSQLDGETYSLTALQPGKYKVTAYKVVSTSYGPKVIAQLVPTDEEGYSSASVTGLTEPCQVWLNKPLSNIFLGNNPTLSEETPAKLYLHEVIAMSNGKHKANAGVILPQPAIAPQGSLSLDF